MLQVGLVTWVATSATSSAGKENIMLPWILGLVKAGLGLTANAALAKGAEWVKDQTGIDIQAPNLSAEQLTQVKQWELEHELELAKLRLEDDRLNLEYVKLVADVAQKEDQSITERWKSDMASDSWLSKNIRPAVLIFLLGAYSLFSLGSAFDVDVKAAYIELLGQWGMLVMTAYFGGRSVEKIVSMVQSTKRGYPK
jgi:hypothetical protein